MASASVVSAMVTITRCSSSSIGIALCSRTWNSNSYITIIADSISVCINMRAGCVVMVCMIGMAVIADAISIYVWIIAVRRVMIRTTYKAVVTDSISVCINISTTRRVMMCIADITVITDTIFICIYINTVYGMVIRASN